MTLENNSCTKCPLSELRTCVLNGVGNLQTKIVFVMDAPSREDDLDKRPFSGPSSRKLDSILSKFNIHRSQVYFTYEHDAELI